MGRSDEAGHASQEAGGPVADIFVQPNTTHEAKVGTRPMPALLCGHGGRVVAAHDVHGRLCRVSIRITENTNAGLPNASHDIYTRPGDLLLENLRWQIAGSRVDIVARVGK